MTTKSGIYHRLWQAFLLQAVVISIAALSGVYAARYVLGDILINRALQDEAKHFWMRYEEDAGASRPATYNLTGYVLPDDAGILPAELEGTRPGFHELDSSESDLFVVYSELRGSRQLVLVFAGHQVGELALFFGMLPLAGVLIVIYLSSWLVYKLSSRAVSPIIKLSRDVDDLDPGSDDFSSELRTVLSGYSNTEPDARTLSAALSKLADRIEAFVMRERNFTRDASHELRSPITVIKIAADLLLDDDGLSDAHRRTVQRIKTNASDMEELIQALLLLARESDNALSMDYICVNDVVQEEMDRAAELLSGKPIETGFHADGELLIQASDKVVSVMLGNLIRNAYSYTDEGRVDISISNGCFTIEDSGIGISQDDMEKVFKPFERGKAKQRGGYGVGLTIVNMLSERFHWPIDIDSELNRGTRVTIAFSNSLNDSQT